MNLKPKVSIVLLNYLHWKDTIACLESIYEHINYSNYELIIVDNLSPNDSVEALTNYLNQLSVVNKPILKVNQANLGFANGNNLGIKLALARGADFVWLLNNDTFIKDDALSPLLKAYKGNVGILGSKLIFYPSDNLIQAVGATINKFSSKIVQIGFNEKDKGQYDNKKLTVDFVVGASLFVSKELLEKVGMLSEDYFMYFEELDWSLRAKKKGFKTDVCTSSVVYHKQGLTTKNQALGEKNKVAMYFQFKNLLLIYRKYFWYYYPIVLLVVFLRVLKFNLANGLKDLDLFYKVFLKPKKFSFE